MRPLLRSAALLLMVAACSRKPSPVVQKLVEKYEPAATAVATDAVRACAAVKDRVPTSPAPAVVPPPPPSPAKGTAFEADNFVVDVLVMCSWPDPKNPSISAGTGLSSLKGTRAVMLRPVTLPEDISGDTCQKDARSCRRVVTPSRYDDGARTADLHVTRPLPDGGHVEVTVILAAP